MNERDLRYLVAIVDGGTLRAASEHVHVTQPALTKCIERLEDQVGAALFAKRGRHVVPTEVGHVLALRARAILRNIDEAQREVSDYASGQRGHVRLGAAATLTQFIIPGIVETLSREAPNITVDLMIGMSDVLRGALRHDKLDLVLGPVVDNDEFDCIPLQDDDVVVVASATHPLAGKAVTPADLTPFRWVLPPRSVALRDWLEQSFAKVGLPPPRVQVEVNSLALMPELIARTDLLSFVSRQNLSAERSSSAIVELPICGLRYRRAFGAITRKGSYIPIVSQRVIDVAQAIVR